MNIARVFRVMTAPVPSRSVDAHLATEVPLPVCWGIVAVEEVRMLDNGKLMEEMLIDVEM